MVAQQTSVQVGPEGGHLCADVGQQPGEGGGGQQHAHDYTGAASCPERPQASARFASAGTDNFVKEETAVGPFVA
jgi:hypothetical protein